MKWQILLFIIQCISCGAYRVNHDDIAKRDLRNVCLAYLAVEIAEQTGNQLVDIQYRSDNMTQTDACCANAAAMAQLPCKDTLLQEFDDKWHQDGWYGQMV